MRANNSQRQAGFVSLFTVIFFVLLVTVITVGFLRIMVLEQRQALDNDLSASARAAAESGIEDAKRALLAYYNPSTPGALKTDLTTAFTTDANNCDSLTGKTEVQNQLGINGKAVGSNDFNQEFTCLTVKLNTPDYLGNTNASVSEILPLRGVSDFNQIKIQWHLLSPSIGADGDGQPQNLPPGGLFQPQTGNPSWNSLRYPAYLRVQLFGYPSGSFTRAQLEDRSRTVFLVPVAGDGAPIDLGVADANPRAFNGSKSAPSSVNPQCSTNYTQFGSYLCTATLQLPAGAQFASSGNTYFLRVTPIYSQAHFRIQLYNSSTGTSVDFKEVQPIVDSTGRAEDVYRRVQNRVRINAAIGLPEYAAESATDICKTIQVPNGSNVCP